MTTRRTFLGTAAALAQPAARPNVLWIMADELRFDCLGANGNGLIRTPNLDHLAARSANFQRGFVQSPVCVPSRISYFTGRYPHSHKNRVNYTPVDSREVLVQRMFQDAGYRTGSVGKLHFYPPTAAHARSTGFDRVLLDDGVAATDPWSDYVAWRKNRDPQAHLPYSAVAPLPGKNPFRGAIAYEYTPTAWTGAETRGLLREFAATSKPFFLFSSFFKPHAPYTVPEPYDSMYDAMDLPLPRRVTLDDIKLLPPPVQNQILRGANPPYAMDRDRLQWIYRSYYGAVAMVDREVGLILDELDRSGQAGNTIVVFSSDHGDQLLEHGLEGKNVFFEASVRVPLLMSWPGRIQAGPRRELIEMVDVLPTLLDLVSVTLPKTVQGRSFAALLTGNTYRPRSFVFAENVIPEVITNRGLNLPYVPGEGVGGIRHPDAKMIRTSRWKLNHYVGNGGELYDLESDPGERRNVYADAAHRHIMHELKDQLLDFLITADETDQIAPHWLVRQA